jgi:hypothetical protein
VDDVELLEGHPQGFELGQGGGHPDRPELAAHATGPKARDVRIDAVDESTQVDGRRLQANSLAERARQVVVAVDERSFPKDLPGACDERACRGGPAAIR